MASILARDNLLNDVRMILDRLFSRREECIERLRLQLPHARDGVQVRHLGLGEHFLLDVQDCSIDLVGDERRNVLARDRDEVYFFRIDLCGTQHAAAEEVGEAARFLDADALALEIGHRLDLAAHHHRGLKFGQIGG